MSTVLVILGLLDERRRQPLDDLLGDPVVLAVILAHYYVGQFQRVARDDVRDLHVALVDVVPHARVFSLPRRRLWLLLSTVGGRYRVNSECRRCAEYRLEADGNFSLRLDRLVGRPKEFLGRCPL